MVREAPQLIGSAGMSGMQEIDAIDGEDDALAARMIAATEDEIFREGTTNEPEDDNSGDKTLEHMAEGFDDEAAEDLQDGEEPGPDDEEGDGEEQSGEDDGDTEDAIEEPGGGRQEVLQTRQEPRQERFQPSQDQETIAELRERLARLEGAQQRPQPEPAADRPAKPDMFADPEGYERYILEQAETRAAARYQQQAQQDRIQRVDRQFDEASRDPQQGMQFQAAYNALKTTAQAAAARGARSHPDVDAVLNAPDPVSALMHWADRNGVLEDYQQTILAQAEAILGRQIAPRRGENRGEQRQPAQGARNGARDPRITRTLNGRSGSGTHREINPEMSDGSEASIFAYGARN